MFGASLQQQPGTIIEDRPNPVTLIRAAQLCQGRTGIQTVPLHAPALSAKTSGPFAINMGRQVGTIKCPCGSGKKYKSVMGAKDRTKWHQTSGSSHDTSSHGLTPRFDHMEHNSSIPFELLTTSSQVYDLAQVLQQELSIAIDTESNSRHRYPERVCLVQVATCSKVYLVDTLAVDDMKPIGKVLADETVVKVIQGAEYDIRCLDREWGFRVRNIFDTSVAAPLCWDAKARTVISE